MFMFLVIHFIMNFFVINSLLIPPVHWFSIMRLALWFSEGTISFREGYNDFDTWNTVERKHNPVEGRYRWLGIASLLTECLMCWKFRHGTGNIIEAPTPFYISFPWAAGLSFMFAYWLFLRFKPDATKKYIEPEEAEALERSKKGKKYR